MGGFCTRILFLVIRGIMSDPNQAPFTFVESSVLFEQIFDLLQDHEQKRLYNFVPRRMLVNLCYINELDTPLDPTMHDVFLNTRKFIQNDSGDVVTVTGNFVPWDFQPNVVYCCSNLELSFFLAKAKLLNLPLIEETYNGWLDQGDPPRSFFWS